VHAWERWLAAASASLARLPPTVSARDRSRTRISSWLSPPGCGSILPCAGRKWNQTNLGSYFYKKKKIKKRMHRCCLLPRLDRMHMPKIKESFYWKHSSTQISTCYQLFTIHETATNITVSFLEIVTCRDPARTGITNIPKQSRV
jgi:hypothetical protein